MAYLGRVVCWIIVMLCIYAEWKLIALWIKDSSMKAKQYPRVVTGGVLIRKKD